MDSFFHFGGMGAERGPQGCGSQGFRFALAGLLFPPNPRCCNVRRCMLQLPMIESFRHRGLKRLYEQGDGSKVRADQLDRISDVLLHLDKAQEPGDLDLPGCIVSTRSRAA